MKVEEIRGLNPEELNKQLEAANQELFDLRLKLSTKELVNHRQIRVTRKNIARLKTIIREKELGLR